MLTHSIIFVFVGVSIYLYMYTVFFPYDIYRKPDIGLYTHADACYYLPKVGITRIHIWQSLYMWSIL